MACCALAGGVMLLTWTGTSFRCRGRLYPGCRPSCWI